MASSSRAQKRVFKKSSLSEVVTVYLGKRDFYDHGSHVDPIDGVVAVNEAALEGKKVFARFSAVFNFFPAEAGAVDVGVRKNLFTETLQVFPVVHGPGGAAEQVTRLQKKLLAKVGRSAYPFLFRLPPGVPSSVTLQSLSAADPGSKRCGLDHEVTVFVADASTAKFAKKDSVRLNVRKLSYALPNPGAPLPSGKVEKTFLLGSGQLTLEARLDKANYYHGEEVKITLNIDNQSARSVKSVVIKVRQFSQFRTSAPGAETFTNKCTIAQLESTIGFPINTGTRTEHAYALVPSRQDNLKQLHLALDGQLKDEDTGLASSTILTGEDASDAIGIIVSYDVKIILVMHLASDVVCKLPFVLSAPVPEPEETPKSKSPAARRADPSTKGRPPAAFPAEPTTFEDDELELEFVEFMKGRAEKFYSATHEGEED